MKSMNVTQFQVLCVVLVVIVPQAKADFAFGEPTKLGLLINTPHDDLCPSISPDGLSLYFSSTRPGGLGGAFGDIWVATRQTLYDPWDTPLNLGPKVNSPSSDGARVSPDGLALYISSGRSGGCGGEDIWVAIRETKDSDWGIPMNLGEIVNSLAHEVSPSVSADGLELYFSGWKSPFRPGGYGSADLWITKRTTKNDPWGEPSNLGPVVNSSSQDARPCISADGRVLFFDSQRPGGYGYGDLYMTTRASRSDPWGKPVNLGPKVNTSAFEELPHISVDGRTLYFDRANASNWSDGTIWQVEIIPTVDFNGDRRVNIDDLLILIEHWGQNEPAYDMGPMPWGDGVIDEADLEVLMRHWGQDDSFLAHWRLDETEGDVAYDSIGENDAVVMGDAVWLPEGGQIDGALELDGIDDFINTLFELNPADGPFSVFAWVKGGAPGQVILSQKNGVNWLRVDVDGTLMTELRNSGQRRPSSLRSETVITDGKWHRIGFVWDGSQRILYVDDIPVALDSQGSLDGATGGLIIGAGTENQDGTFWSGRIDDVRIYDRVVTP